MRNAIFIVFNDKYFDQAKVCLYSIHINFPEHPEILVMYKGKNEEVVKYLKTYNNLRLLNNKFLIPNAKIFDKGPINSNLIYLRYILWSDNFDDYDNILHLDVDTIILKPLDTLISKKNFFAVVDNMYNAISIFKQEYLGSNELGVLLREDGILEKITQGKMLNAGVFVIPKKYRKRKYFNQLMDITNRYNLYISFADQSAISIWCIYNNIKLSEDIIYNYQPTFGINTSIFYYMVMKKKIPEDICIFHFTWWKINSLQFKKLLIMSKFHLSINDLFKEFGENQPTLGE